MRNAQLTRVALQIGSVEAEHRVGVRFYAIQAGVITGTPNDVAFEKAMFTSVAGAADALKTLGFIGGTGTQITYPGPGAIDTADRHAQGCSRTVAVSPELLPVRWWEAAGVHLHDSSGTAHRLQRPLRGYRRRGVTGDRDAARFDADLL